MIVGNAEKTICLFVLQKSLTERPNLDLGRGREGVGEEDCVRVSDMCTGSKMGGR